MNKRIMEFIVHLGISVSEFERNCGLSNGAVSKIGEKTRRLTLDRISKTYPSLNIDWLLTGTGDMMLAGPVHQTNQHGDNIHGRQVTVNKTEKEYIDIIKKQAEQLSKSQSHIDHLLSIIDRLQKE